ncbi:ABC transporter ATP-binding protein [Natronorubrum daqingense]|uniref:ABC-type D-xylose/L-arabinose transporter n=1 Tax=Natronorubrum daqingense TaxID=588898 RepID=A0A1N7E7H9_9EURY|nr:ABC transporter ATP-binding protein [Natronorubrum daqingense]APX96402.1 ABC transporter [Natronorubrum daqingense]SIR83976.1 multiple sugar transport system ATP-binding protein [Natronorubrum daqingense]
MAAITIQNLTKRFGSLVAVDDFSLTIEDGEFITLVGPSGCGKTTTLRCVAGLESTTSGTVMFGEHDVTDYPVQQRGIALLFQDIALYPHMTVEENIGYPLKLEGQSKEQRSERVRDAAEMLQIEDQLEKHPSELSGGQQQRVALGRSIVREPAMFLFDEPMSDLDAKLKHELRPLFAEVTEKVGCPTMYVTHDQEEAMTMSDRIAVMNDGELEQVGTPREVYDEPQSSFVGEFIGRPNMEFFDADVSRQNGTMDLSIGDTAYQIATSEALAQYEDGNVRIGIRPQDISVSSDADDGLTGEHVFDETLGDQTHSLFDTPLGRLTVVTPPKFRGNGQQYGLEFDTNAMKAFDPKSGLRIE